MANTPFIVPKLRDNGAWRDYKNQYTGGFGWRYDRPLSSIRYVANHHSVTNPSGNAKTDVDTIWNIHRANGWGGIGYEFIITSQEVTGKDGLKYAIVAHTGDIGSVRAHTPNSKGALGLRAGYGNENIIAACMIGMLHQKNPTDAQIRSAYWLYRELVQEEPQRLPNLKGTLSAKLQAHSTFDATACPGNWNWQKPRIVNYTDPPKVERKEETRVATVPFERNTVETDTLPKGETKITQAGKDGEKRVIWEVTYTNGKETSRKIKSETIIAKAVDEITSIGTYVEPEVPEPINSEEPVNPPTPPEESVMISLIRRLLEWLVGLFK